jgi:hypothetical protein
MLHLHERRRHRGRIANVGSDGEEVTWRLVQVEYRHRATHRAGADCSRQPDAGGAAGDHDSAAVQPEIGWQRRLRIGDAWNVT